MHLLRAMVIMRRNKKSPAQLEFQPMVLDQLIKEVDVRLGDDGDDDADDDDNDI